MLQNKKLTTESILTSNSPCFDISQYENFGDKTFYWSTELIPLPLFTMITLNMVIT